MKNKKVTLILTLALMVFTAFGMADIDAGWSSSGIVNTINSGWSST